MSKGGPVGGVEGAAAEASARAKARNERTLRIEMVENGYIVTEAGTGATFAYPYIGNGLETDSVTGHLFKFFGRLRSDTDGAGKTR